MESAEDMWAKEEFLLSEEEEEELRELEEMIHEETSDNGNPDINDEDHSSVADPQLDGVNTEWDLDNGDEEADEVTRQKRNAEALMLQNLLTTFLRKHDLRFVPGNLFM